MKFECGSFGPIKNFPKNFFTGRFSGSGPEMHRFVRTLEEVWVGAIYSCYERSLFISGSPRKRVLDFKIQNKTQLLHSKKKTQLLKWMVVQNSLIVTFYRWRLHKFLSDKLFSVTLFHCLLAALIFNAAFNVSSVQKYRYDEILN